MMTEYKLGGWSRFVLPRGDETWITASPWIGDEVVKFDVADENNCHRLWEFMSREAFDRLRCE